MQNEAGDRAVFLRKGQRLEYFTIAYNCLEGIVSVVAGLAAGSISLVGFGLDSFIEVTSAAALIWRFSRDRDPAHRERAERRSLGIVGACFLTLAVYVAYEAIDCLRLREAPGRSIPGIAIAVVSLVIMPLLANAKRKVAARIDSAALRADARQTDFCTYLSAILVAGLLLNALLGFWWADPVAALSMVPIIANEGLRGIRGRATCACSHERCSAETLRPQ